MPTAEKSATVGVFKSAGRAAGWMTEHLPNDRISMGRRRMEIVDKTPDPKVQREKVCTSCGVKLRYLKPDVKTHVRTDYTGGKDAVYQIVCPNCNQDLIVKPWY